MSLLVPDLKDLAVRYIVRNITVVSKTRGSQPVEESSSGGRSIIPVQESTRGHAGWSTGAACVNTYALTLTYAMKMANTTAWIEKFWGYKARIRSIIIRNTIEIPIMVIDPSYRMK
jgi:hypothetical protein